ncbi:MAG: tRNA (adenosine(37)-N6)-threonylcarbamoyltransferase complex ATPase subunit type 1 TsaE [Actinomycetota bacterium]
MGRIVCVSRSVEETRAIAAALADSLRGGDVIVLSGDLGAGKTTFVQGAAAGLGVRAHVTSPSFVLVREYAGRVRLIHIDVYRLTSLEELIDLGYEEIFAPDAVAFIEWGDVVAGALPEDRIDVDIRSEDDTRRITISAVPSARLDSMSFDAWAVPA